MSNPRKAPSYRLHKPTGKAVVTLPDGQGDRKDVYLGPYGSPESRRQYARVIIEWESRERTLPPPGRLRAGTPDLTVNELLLAYFKEHVESWYVKDGRPTSEQACIRSAAGFVKERYGHLRAAEFGPLALQAVRDAMIAPRVRVVKQTDPASGEVRRVEKSARSGLSRETINKNLSRIKAIFKWGVSQELIDVEVYQRLATVSGLVAGRTAARETEPISSVADHVVEATLPHLPEVVADMIRMQRLSGCRPGELVQLRACDLDMTRAVWEFRPTRHKNQHRKRERVVYIGPTAQAILRRYFTLDMTAPLFRPDESERRRNEERSRQRKAPRWPSHAPEVRQLRREEERGHAPESRPGERYTTQTYARAIARGCVKAGVPHWAPNQLRHTAGTAVRKRYGLEAAQVVLGHAEANVTQIYAETDAEAARRVMAEIG
jgi:integrase